MRGIKICGINTAEAFAAAVAAGADYVGFVFHAASPRAVTPAFVAGLPPGGPPRVGLFVRPTPGDIADIGAVGLDALQLYGADITAIRAVTTLPLWDARGVATAADLPAATEADALLIEAKAPPGATRPGGLGLSIDWPMLSDWRPAVPWMLAGGLTAANVTAAIVASGATAVDVSSGVESSPGIKDPAAIAAFVRAARAAFNPLLP